MILKDDPAFFTLPQKKKFYLDLNEENAKLFEQGEEDRLRFFVEGSSFFCGFPCGDGRTHHLARMTKTSLGIIKIIPSLGGLFKIGWPSLQKEVVDWMKRNKEEEKCSVFITTYHFSRSSKARCCAGFSGDTKKAFTAAWNFRKELELLFGKNNNTLVITIGIETDSDSFILHGDDPKKTLDLFLLDECHSKPSNVLNEIMSLIPSIRKNVAKDLLMLLMGNLRHIKEVKASGRKPENSHHQESLIYMGKNSSWLNHPNTALLISTLPLNITKQATKALTVMHGNIEHGRIRPEWIFMPCASYNGNDETGISKRGAEFRTKEFTDFFMNILTKQFPKRLADKMFLMEAIFNEDDRRITVI
jgi:hypothetical protein